MEQSRIDALARTLKSLGLLTLLYPLERLQAVKQLQPTYADPLVQQHTSIISRALHAGLKTYFRGYMPFITKTGLLTAVVQFAPAMEEGQKWLTAGLGLAAYAILYPFEAIQLRICAEVDRQRFYPNVRECFSKIKKNEGMRVFYRAFPLGCLLLGGQVVAATESVRIAQQLPNLTTAERCGSLLAILAAAELLLFPLSTLKKQYQVNGAIGHSDRNTGILANLKLAKGVQLWRGYLLRMTNWLAFAALYLLTSETPRLHV